MISSVHANNRASNILVLGKDFIQRINGRTSYAEKMYSTNFTVTSKTFCLRLHYNDDSSYLFANGKEIINFKAKDSEIVSYPLCLGNVSKDFSPLNTTNTGLYGYIRLQHNGWILFCYIFIYIYVTKTEREVVNPSKPKFYKRLVGDIINRRNKNQPDDLFQKLSSNHSNIQLK